MVRERAIAYAEVYAILKMMNPQYMNKIPNRLKTIIMEEMDKNYKPQVNPLIPLKEQKFNAKTYTILAMINLNYWCESEEHKKELVSKYNENEQKYQEELREKYNSENLFKKRNNFEENIQGNNSIETAMVEYKEKNFIQKLFDNIKKIFGRN